MLSPPRIAPWLALLSGPLWAQSSVEPQIGLDLAADATFGMAPGELRNSALQGQALVHASWGEVDEGEPLSPWRGYVSVLALAGKGPTEKFVGDLNALSNLEADKGVRLYSWWGEMNRGDCSFRAGALLADEEFATTESGGALFNSGFGWPGFVSGNTVNTGPAYFIPALGIRVRWTPRADLVVQALVTDGDSWDSPEGDSSVNRHGWRYSLGGDQGYFGMAEIAWTVGETGLTGKLGAWHHTGDFADTYFDADGVSFVQSGNDPHLHSSNGGTYAVLTHAKEKPFGLPGFWDTHVRYGWANKSRNAVSEALDLGWTWSGIIPGRDDDALAVGFLETRLSAPFTRALKEADVTQPRLSRESVVEFGYHWQINETYSVHPDFQVIRNPGGDPSRPSAKVVVLRFTAEF